LNNRISPNACNPAGCNNFFIVSLYALNTKPLLIT
jgi:hypothetical protein